MTFSTWASSTSQRPEVDTPPPPRAGAAPETKHVFISYAREDHTTARKLAEALKSRGEHVWWDRSILAGKSFEHEIRKALDAARCVIVLWSRHSVKSDWVLDEAQQAKDRSVLVPALIEGVPIPLGFGRIQTEDLADWEGDPEHNGLRRLMRAVEAIDGRVPGPGIDAKGNGPEPGIRSTTPTNGITPHPPILSEGTEPGPQRGAAGERPTVTTSQESAGKLQRLLSTRGGLTGILAVAFVVNWGETALETTINGNLAQKVTELGLQNAHAFHWLERHFSFASHDVTNMLAVRGYSSSYFFVFPAVIVGLGLFLAIRDSITPYRVFSLSIVTSYLLSLPFFIFFPVPERWAYPESNAILLSDKWSSQLIETFRPISGLDNCFPSFHTCMTVIAILLCFRFRTRLRWSILAIGLTIILSTLVLGIHWLADVVAGTAVAVLAIHLALRVDRALSPRSVQDTYAFRR